jgi:hypothetical protein
MCYDDKILFVHFIGLVFLYNYTNFSTYLCLVYIQFYSSLLSAGIKHNYINRAAYCYGVNIELCELCGTFYGSEEQYH